ncbi:MAG: prepilin-type N-terminal cleavage/methylation domain-containing protein [Syntrophobacteraceae bacterium]|jgi:prepilin-type N-terminal cleavage/methylation domain-containing protein
MFVKMRESKGFTLVRLMIVVALIGILAVVAAPYYQRHIQKAGTNCNQLAPDANTTLDQQIIITFELPPD